MSELVAGRVSDQASLRNRTINVKSLLLLGTGLCTLAVLMPLTAARAQTVTSQTSAAPCVEDSGNGELACGTGSIANGNLATARRRRPGQGQEFDRDGQCRHRQ